MAGDPLMLLPPNFIQSLYSSSRHRPARKPATMSSHLPSASTLTSASSTSSSASPPISAQTATRLDVANSLLLNPKGSTTTLSRLDLHQLPSDKPVYSCAKCSEVLVG